MILTLPDEPALKDLAESNIRLDLACALYTAGRLTRSVSARFAELESGRLDEELFQHHISFYTAETMDEDLATLEKRFRR